MELKNQKQKAKTFVETWTKKIAETETNKSNERQFCQLFWTTLLTEVFGIENVAEFIDFERPVPKEFSSGKNFIDGYIASTKVLIEQKASKIDLSKGEKQSDGQFLTPYQQAKRYGSNQNYSERPRWIIVSNFVSFEIHDMDRMDSESYTIRLEDLPNELHNLSMIYDTGKKEIKEEMALSVEAGKIVDELYEILSKKYNDSPAHQRSLNMLCVRLIFLLYADDSELFGRKGMFHSFVESYSAENLGEGIKQLFAVLNVKEKERPDKFFDLNEKFSQFPYVNGNLFSEEDNLIPRFNEEIRNLLLEKGNFNWKDISPTIFGAVFESTLNPETRHDGGMHYTSIENIHKVIDPLFLDNLKEEFVNIKSSSKSSNQKKAEYETLQNKLASIKIFDPACGSGNFLTESYLSLRRLENKILEELGNSGLFVDEYIKVSIQQFYGIEINDFAVSVAKTALWIAEAQTFLESPSSVNSKSQFFPLETYNNIVEGNALRLDWEEVFPVKMLKQVQHDSHSELDSESLYIIGNPPFLGARVMNEEQKKDVLSVFGEKLKGVGNLDYVSCWYKKCADLMKGTQIHAALVSTNSITQGEQPAILFKPLFEDGIKFDFAYRTFRWDSESTEKAHVHCVIIGFSCNCHRSSILLTQNQDKEMGKSLDFPNPCDTLKRIYTSDKVFVEAKNINAYLLDAPNIFIESRNKPLCDVPEIGIGNKPIDGGNYLFTEDEMKEFIKKEPKSEKLFRKWVGSDEFINRYFRYCLFVGKVNPSELVKMPEVMKRIKAVEEFRLSSSSKPTQKLAETPTRFHVENFPESTYIIIPEVSSEKRKYIPMGFMTPDVIASNLVKILPDATLYDFGILTSNVHNAWMRAVCGRLKSDYRYSKDIVYNNFPFPQQLKIDNAKLKMQNGKWTLNSEDLPTDKTELSIINSQLKIINTAQSILDARAKYPDSSLGEMYSNILLYPELNKAHKENDKAVMEAYGFKVGISESECVGKLFGLYEGLVK